MRTLTGHKINPVNDIIEIRVVDEPGQGGANHEYEVDWFVGPPLRISFQNGPIGENGVNGLTQEVLLEIVADRLRSFQAGPFPCKENEVALTHIETAQLWLHKRTLDRMQRQVEGLNRP